MRSLNFLQLDWMKFVTFNLHAWEEMNLSWGKNFSRPVLLVYYDDLVVNVEKTLRDILLFIDYPINEDLLRCTVTRKEGIYKRKQQTLTFNPYTYAMEKMIEEKREQVYTKLGRYNKP
jgi:hypothetical protein